MGMIETILRNSEAEMCVHAEGRTGGGIENSPEAEMCVYADGKTGG